MVSATIVEAKTKLSELVKKAQKGEMVVITSGRDKTPVRDWKRFIQRQRSGWALWLLLASY